MRKCYRCEQELTKANEAEEHILLNACGGRLKSKNLLCKICNSQFGETFDKEFASQTNDLANLLLIKRHRGEPQPIKGKRLSTNEDYYLLYGGNPMMSKPVINEDINGQQIQLSITARDEKEMRTILEGLKRKRYPEIDVEQSMKTAKKRQEYFDEPIHFKATIGGNEAFKSLTKSAINFFIYKGGDRKFITHLIPYLDDTVNLEIVWLHYPDKTIYTPAENEVSHIIRLVGNPTERILYAYIELFNTYNFIIKVNENYTGIKINETYAFDLTELKELVRSIPIGYTRGQLLDMFINKNGKPFVEIQRRFERVLSIAMRKQASNHNKELISKAINKSLRNYPQGTPITEDMIKELVNETMKEITPMILHHFNRKATNDDE